MRQHRDSGFSLIELLIAIAVISTGLLALTGTLVLGISLPQRARNQVIAKQIANTIMETIISTKEAPRGSFANFSDFSQAGAGRFDGQNRSILIAGPDGVYGTCDDGSTSTSLVSCSGGSPSVGTTTLAIYRSPGADGRYDTINDNERVSLTNFTRTVTITDVPGTGSPATVKEVRVQVFYPGIGNVRESVNLVCRISSFRTL
jgi:prepilin-type N-terminal cleavage/methylation domain-containing protein